MKVSRDYQQCVRCVMDTSDPDIRFDANGICNNCTDFLVKMRMNTNKTADAKQLDQLVKKIKIEGRRNQYDCVLGISGGIDSCYTAYLLKQLGLRTLLVHMDNGWDAEEAILNIKRIAQFLNFDYESYILDWTEFKDLQLSFLKASVIEAETPTDVAILGALHEIAATYNVKYIISGGNQATEGILPKHWHYDAKDLKFLKAVQKRFGNKILKKFPSFSYMKEAYYKLIKRVKIIYILNYINYSKEEVITVLKNELDWIYYGGKHHESRYTKFIQGYLLPVKFNLDYRKATFSTQICMGELTRADALKKLQYLSYDPDTIEQDKEYIAKKLGIGKEQLENIIQLPVKTYKDYPNNEKVLQFIYKLYRKYF